MQDCQVLCMEKTNIGSGSVDARKYVCIRVLNMSQYSFQLGKLHFNN